MERLTTSELSALPAEATEDEKYRLPPVRISTEYGSDFKGADGGPLSGADVTQHNERYSEETTYELRFRPSSVVRSVNGIASSVKLRVNFPKEVTPKIDTEAVPASRIAPASIGKVDVVKGLDFANAEDAATRQLVTKGCEIYEGTVARTDARCYKSSEADLFEIHNALGTEGEGFSGVATIVLRLMNPDDNWGAVGFKLRSQEVAEGSAYEVDKLEGDELRPQLQCEAPCHECLMVGKLERPSVIGAVIKNGQ